MQNINGLLFVVLVTVVASSHKNIGADVAFGEVEWRNLDELKQDLKESPERVDCSLRPESPQCLAETKQAVLSQLFNSWKDEVKAKLEAGHGDRRRGCRPRPGSAWCTGKRELTEEAREMDVKMLEELFE